MLDLNKSFKLETSLTLAHETRLLVILASSFIAWCCGARGGSTKRKSIGLIRASLNLISGNSTLVYALYDLLSVFTSRPVFSDFFWPAVVKADNCSDDRVWFGLRFWPPLEGKLSMPGQ